MRHYDPARLDVCFKESEMLAVARLHLFRRDAFDLADVVDAVPAQLLNDGVPALEVGPKRCRRDRAISQCGTKVIVAEQGRGSQTFQSVRP